MKLRQEVAAQHLAKHVLRAFEQGAIRVTIDDDRGGSGGFILNKEFPPSVARAKHREEAL